MLSMLSTGGALQSLMAEAELRGGVAEIECGGREIG